MKRKELFAVLLAAVMLVGCGSDTSREFKGSEEAHGREETDATEGTSESADEASTVEETKDEAVAEATEEKVEETEQTEQAERTEKASAEYPFLLVDINWDTPYYPTTSELGYTAGTPSTMDGSIAGLNNGKIVTYKDCEGDDDFLMINLIYVDNKLSSVALETFDGADRLDRYREMFTEYYGEPDVKTDDETAFIWYSEQATVMLDAFPNFDGDKTLEVRYMTPAKNEDDKKKAEMIFEAQHGTISIEINQSEG